MINKNENIYRLTWGHDLDENILLITNANEKQIQNAINKKNRIIAKECNPKSDSEIFRDILVEKYTCKIINLDNNIKSFQF